MGTHRAERCDRVRVCLDEVLARGRKRCFSKSYRGAIQRWITGFFLFFGVLLLARQAEFCSLPSDGSMVLRRAGGLRLNETSHMKGIPMRRFGRRPVRRTIHSVAAAGHEAATVKPKDGAQSRDLKVAGLRRRVVKFVRCDGDDAPSIRAGLDRDGKISPATATPKMGEREQDVCYGQYGGGVRSVTKDAKGGWERSSMKSASPG